jgi:hypothetical protein
MFRVSHGAARKAGSFEGTLPRLFSFPRTLRGSGCASFVESSGFNGSAEFLLADIRGNRFFRDL